ncbi:hypothetical protein SMGD1_1997 [Sulfurimonas gotlandica GD1]|uniref:Uncharacterized protein n=1 Tax=Sulfurimonas gotlandica (strain DSM 19862 / JCM 16533 / GD1) TaxID=929558 RepID=H1FWU4_SULGG|nr:hypothetical protein [Sulfurimonas gotlandica]EHP30520.1 hypothetical protein SMGD1_1997 [Sulfurimonas gotlandica GD1]
MTRPEKVTKEYLKEQLSTLGWIGTRISSTNIIENPKLKKRYFWIYHYEMPYESAKEVFWKEEHKLSFKKAMDLMDKLEENKIPYAMISNTFHRLGTKVFNYEKLKQEWPDMKFAVSFDEDTDEEYKGFK